MFSSILMRWKLLLLVLLALPLMGATETCDEAEVTIHGVPIKVKKPNKSDLPPGWAHIIGTATVGGKTVWLLDTDGDGDADHLLDGEGNVGEIVGSPPIPIPNPVRPPLPWPPAMPQVPQPSGRPTGGDALSHSDGIQPSLATFSPLPPGFDPIDGARLWVPPVGATSDSLHQKYGLGALTSEEGMLSASIPSLEIRGTLHSKIRQTEDLPGGYLDISFGWSSILGIPRVPSTVSLNLRAVYDILEDGETQTSPSSHPAFIHVRMAGPLEDVARSLWEMGITEISGEYDGASVIIRGIDQDDDGSPESIEEEVDGVITGTRSLP